MKRGLTQDYIRKTVAREGGGGGCLVEGDSYLNWPDWKWISSFREQKTLSGRCFALKQALKKELRRE
jgi:hypothetical protein